MLEGQQANLIDNWGDITQLHILKSYHDILWSSCNIYHTMELFSRRRWATGSAQQSTLDYAMYVLHKFFRFNINTTAFCLGRSSLHFLLLKSSMGILSYLLRPNQIAIKRCWTEQNIKVRKKTKNHLKQIHRKRSLRFDAPFFQKLNWVGP